MMKIFFRLVEINFKEIFRNPEILFWGIGFPILMAIGLGVAFSVKTDSIRPVAIIINNGEGAGDKLFPMKVIDVQIQQNLEKIGPINLDGQQIERYQVVVDSNALGKNKVIFHLTNSKLADLLIKRGIVLLLVETHRKAERQTSLDKTMPTSSLHYKFDPRNGEAQLTYLITRSLLEEMNLPALDTAVTPLKVPGTRYIDFLIPGLVSMGVMMSCMWGISYGLIEKRSKKLLRRLIATPMSKLSFLFSMVVVRILFGLLESSMLVLIIGIFFDFKIIGSWLLVILVFLTGYFAFSGIAILMAARSNNVETGNGLINAVTTPMIVLSGIFFSYQHFPVWATEVISFFPLTLIVDSFRRVMLEGGTIMSITPALILLVGIGAITTTVGLKIFKWS